jgi:hypothetical protein
MRFIRTKLGFATRIICLLMALYLFNFSIDTRDANPDIIPEDLTVNDIESFIEFVTEDVFGFNNAIAEHDEHDADDGGSFEFIKMFFNKQIPIFIAEFKPVLGLKFLVFNTSAVPSRTLEITSPPPKG